MGKNENAARRIISLMLAFTMLLSVIPQTVIAAPEDDTSLNNASLNDKTGSQIKIGEYLVMGVYNGQPIRWVCIGIDENGPLMMTADNIIGTKEFDKESESGGSHDNSPSRGTFGSGCWFDSNIRSWLNSNEEDVTWLCGNPPETYSDEAGFKTGFTSLDMTAVKTAAAETELNEADSALPDSTNDEFFLLSKTEFEAYSSNIPTNSTYWLRSPYDGLDDCVYVVGTDGVLSSSGVPANESSAYNIRPAFYLKEDTIFSSGDGKASYPFAVDAVVDRPAAENYSFKYDGTKHTALTVSDETGLELVSGDTSAVNAGQYSVTVKPKEGSFWADTYTAEPVTLSWEITPREVTLRSHAASKEYDGTRLTNHDLPEISGDGFIDGEGLDIAFGDDSFALYPGDAVSNVFTYTAQDGTDPDNYNIKSSYGILTVTSREAKYQLTLIPNSGEVTYSGAEQSLSGFEELSFDIEEKTYTVSGLAAEAKGTDAGTYPVEVSGNAVVRDADGRDVTDEFEVKVSDVSSLVINKREITLASASASKEYDGTVLKNDTVTVSGDGFAPDEGFDYEVTGSQLIPGTSANEFTYTPQEGTQPGNYSIVKAEGTLTVTSRGAAYTVLLAANSGTFLYDGAAHTVSGFTVNGEAGNTFTAENGEEYTLSGLSAETEGTDAGEYIVNVAGTPVITDSEGNEVTDQFRLTAESGRLVINRRSVTLTSATALKLYDGEALTAEEVTVSGDGFADSESISSYIFGTSQKLVGSTPNTFTYVMAEDTKADNYDITVVYGALTVTSRSAAENAAPYEIRVRANSGTAVFDADEHTVSGFEELEFTVNGHKYTVSGLTAAASGTNAGTYATEISGIAAVSDEDGNDVTSEFNVVTENGTLTIEPLPIAITANSRTVKYDGSVQSVSGFENAELNVNGKIFTVSGIESSVSAVNAGVYTTQINGNAAVTDADGSEVSGNFVIMPVSGTLTVEKRSITFRSRSAEKEYDGTALTSHAVDIYGSDGFAEGEGVTFAYDSSASALYPGQTASNTYTYTAKEGTELANYDVTALYGTLTVTPRNAKYEITVRANSDTVLYDGREHTVRGLAESIFTIEGNSYRVTGLTAEGSGTAAGTYTVDLTGTAVVTDAAGADVSDQFKVTPVNGTLTITKRNVILTSAGAEKQYDGTALTNDTVRVSGDGFAEGETPVYNVTGEQRLVGASENTFTYTLPYPENYDITVHYGTLDVTSRSPKYEVILRADSGKTDYDGKMHEVSGYTINGISGGSFTAENGREYTISGMTAAASGTNAGTYRVNVVGTPVIRDEQGNEVTDQFAVSVESGTLTINRRSVTLTSGSDTKVYDGTPLTKSVVTPVGFADGEGAVYEVTGSRTLPGTSDNVFTYILSGADADNYDIKTVYGRLTVTDRTEDGETAKYEITVNANSGEYKYDGYEHTVSGFETLSFTINDNTYTVSGITAEARGIDAGTYTAEVIGTPVVRDADGNDVTAQFNVKTNNGKLTVARRRITFTSSGSTKEYDGTPLTNNIVAVGGDRFAAGEGADFTVTGSQTAVGSSANLFEYSLWDNTAVENYSISVVMRTLTVSNRSAAYEITIKPVSDTIKYDGREHEISGFEKSEFTVNGNIYTVSGLTAEAHGTNAGVYAVEVSGTPVVTDADGRDVSAQFKVIPAEGTLTITKRDITLTSANAAKEYDGKPLANDNITVGGDGLVRGDIISYNVTGERTLVGSDENSFTYTFVAGMEENYSVTAGFGVLTVTSRSAKYEVTLTANSTEYVYDGDDYIVSGYTIDGSVGVAFKAVNDKVYTISGMSAEAIGRNAGEYTVNIVGTPTIKDENGNDVTAEFAVNTESGRLVINKRSITLTSGSASKAYDGTALTNDTVKVSGDGFAENEGAEFTVTGSRTLAGTAENVFTYTLVNADAGNYDIITEYGALTVTDRTESGEDAKYEVTVKANGGEYKYDGFEHSVSGFETLEFEINGNIYTVSGLAAEARGIDAGTYTAEIIGTPVVKDADGNDVTAQFTVNKTNGVLTIAKRRLMLVSSDASKVYDGTPVVSDNVSVLGDRFASGEGADFTVYGAQTVVGGSANLFEYRLWSNTKADNYLISTGTGMLTITPRETAYEIAVKANSDTVMYDGAEHTVSGFESSTFTVDGNNYTVSGLTAQAGGTNAGVYTVEISGTPVVTDAYGNDVSGQFTVIPVSGTLTIARRRIMLASASDTKVYDGSELTNSEISISGDGFVGDDSVEYNVTGTRTLVGSDDNTFTYTLTGSPDNYDVNVSFGTLTVTSRSAKYEVTLTANSNEVIYDGDDYTVSGYTTNGADGLAFKAENGRTYTMSGMSAEATGRDAGTYTVTVVGTPTVKDENGSDVTSEFTVNTESGTLVIKKRSVTLTSASASKIYDGTALANDTVTVSGDGFAEGEGAEYIVTGTRTVLGSSENVFNYTLKDADEDNYEITKVYGTLTVTERSEGGEDAKYEITVRANSGEYKYDGTEHKVSGLEETSFIVDGNKYTVSGLTAQAAGTDAGTYTAEVLGTAVVADADGNDVTAQFKVNRENGTLTVTRREVILTSADAVKEYDGTPLTQSAVTVSGDGFAADEGADYSTTGSQTVSGSSQNTFEYSFWNNTNADNYSITTAEGTLTVTDRKGYEITVAANSDTVVYDGEEHTVSGFVSGEFTVNGNVYRFDGLTAQASGTNAGIYETEISGTAVVTDENGYDVSGQFRIIPVNGTLTITKRNVTLTSASDTKSYDGTALRNSGVEVSGDGFASGDSASYSVTGERTLVGSAENEFTYSLVSGSESNYNIVVNYGTLTVVNTEAEFDITVRALGGTFLYDGSTKTAGGFETLDFEINGNVFTVSGLTAERNELNAGEYTVNVIGTPIVTDEEGNDVTAQFAVNTESGLLTIEKRRVTLTSASAEKEFDGKPLTNEEVQVSGDGFAEGEGAEYSVTGAAAHIGTVPNSFSYTLNANTNESNYDITTAEGSLTVKDVSDKYRITAEAASGTVTYNGQEQSISGLAETAFVFSRNRYILSGLTAEASGTDAGTYTTEIKGTATVTDKDGTDVTPMFEITTKSGTLTIERAVLRAEYTGNTVRTGDVFTPAVQVTGFVNGETELTAAGYTAPTISADSSTEEGSYELTPEGGSADNYSFEYISGVLEVLKAETSRGSRGSSSGGSGSSSSLQKRTSEAGSDTTVNTDTIEETEETEETNREAEDHEEIDAVTQNRWFTDVPESEWYYTDIKYAYDNGIMSGLTNESFGPDMDVTRAMFITVLYRMDGDIDTPLAYTFKDVAKGSYYETAVAWGAANGIISGYSADKFGPDDRITREQMAAMLWRYAKYRGINVSEGSLESLDKYNDAAKVSEYAVPAMKWACGTGIISGYSNSTLSPQENATRAQTAAVSVRLLSKLLIL